MVGTLKSTAFVLRRFFRDSRGSTSLINIITAIPVAVSAGVAIDYTREATAKADIQAKIDAAALAAGAAKNLGGATTSKKLAARRQLALNYLNQSLATVSDAEVVGDPVIAVGPNTVDVAVNARMKSSFTSIRNVATSAARTADIGTETAGDIEFSVSTKVGFMPDSYTCLLSLAPTQKEAVYFQGNSVFYSTCAVRANSNNAVAIRTWGNAYAEATSFCSVGGWSGSGFYPDPLGGCSRLADPYATKAMPAVPTTCNYNNKVVKNATASLVPGTYCGGLSIATNGVANLAPGLYIIKGGKLAVDSQSVLNAPSGVVFYLTGDTSTVDIASGAKVTIVGPNNETASATTAAYKGFAIMQDRSTAVGATNSIYSKGGVDITGTFYAPSQNLKIWANGDMNSKSKYFPMIVNSLDMNGNATLFVRLDFEEFKIDEPVALKQHGKVFVSR